MDGIFDTSPPRRSADEWRTLLGSLVESLSVQIGVRLRPTSWFVHDDQPGHASAGNSVDVRGVINGTIGVDACGVVSVTVNFGEAVWVGCDLLLFACGRRLTGPGRAGVFTLQCERGEWDGAWAADENGEWEAHIDDARWR